MELVNENELEEVSGGKGNWQTNVFVYTVEAGDTLLGIAKRFGTNLNKILRLNTDITNPDLIYVGQKITLPTPQKAGWN